MESLDLSVPGVHEGDDVEVALGNSPQDVDKTGGHDLSHDPKITLDMKIPLEPNLFWKSCVGPATTRSQREEKSPGRPSCGWRLLGTGWCGLACDSCPALCATSQARSGPCPGHQVVEDEEDEDECGRHGEEQPAVVAAGARHAGETLHAARQQPRHAQEI